MVTYEFILGIICYYEERSETFRKDLERLDLGMNENSCWKQAFKNSNIHCILQISPNDYYLV